MAVTLHMSMDARQCLRPQNGHRPEGLPLRKGEVGRALPTRPRGKKGAAGSQGGGKRKFPELHRLACQPPSTSSLSSAALGLPPSNLPMWLDLPRQG
jgi:hypothetical protein